MSQKIHALYKYEYQGEIVYIGKTNSSIKQRLAAHSKEPKFQPYLTSDIFVMPLSNSAETDIMEKLLINKYHPKLNAQDNHEVSTSIQFCEPLWEPYVPASHVRPLRPRRKKQPPLYPGLKFHNYYLSTEHLPSTYATFLEYIMRRVVLSGGEKCEFTISPLTLQQIFGPAIYDKDMLDDIISNFVSLTCAVWCGDEGTRGKYGGGHRIIFTQAECLVWHNIPFLQISLHNYWCFLVLDADQDYAYARIPDYPIHLRDRPYVIYLQLCC